MNGERLKSLRITKGISQKDVANYLGIDRTTYLKYENGSSNPNISRLIKLANFFDTTPNYLLGEDVEQVNISTKHIMNQDSNLNELLNLYNKLDNKSKNRLLGAGYIILAEQNNNRLTSDNIIKSKQDFKDE